MTPPLPAQFAWTEYEQLMIFGSRAPRRGPFTTSLFASIQTVSLRAAAAFQLIRNVLHGSGTLIALRPEDNVAASNVENRRSRSGQLSRRKKSFFSAAAASPPLFPMFGSKRAATAETPEHELLGDLLEAQAAKLVAGGAAAPRRRRRNGSRRLRFRPPPPLPKAPFAWTPARIDAVMNLVGELIIGKSMLNRTLTEFDQKHARDPLRAKLADAMAFQARILDELHKCVLKIRMVPVEQLFPPFSPRVVRDVAKQCGKGRGPGTFRPKHGSRQGHSRLAFRTSHASRPQFG